ncbi:hypothetical protein LZ30DRAFT_580353 [Colletotrichum cereale]|nr:hypothetical protein LZ30DRAFT_580353 [Colletotrichum cereale]
MEEANAAYRASGRPRKGLQICFQCRNRKVRCDGTAGGCENCRRLKFHCSFTTPGQWPGSRGPSAPNSDPSHPKLEKRRVRTACIQCREKKTKCCGTQPSCQRCSHRGVDCQYPELSKSSSSKTLGSDFCGQSSTQMRCHTEECVEPKDSIRNHDVSLVNSPAPLFNFELNSNKTIIKQHIDAFFDFVYPIPCYGFIHKATFCRSWAQESHNPRLLKAMCSVTARYIASGDVIRLQQATRWIHETEMQLLMRLGEPSMSDIEALILVTLDHIIMRRFSKMLVSACLAARLAFLMRLNYEDNRLTFLIRERRRRLMWAIVTMETLYSSGRSEFTSCPKAIIHLQLPCNENSFALDIPVTTEPLDPPGISNTSDLGLVAYNVRVLDIRDRIQKLSHTITHRREPLVECVTLIKGLVDELEGLRLSLSPMFAFDKKNLFLRAYTPQRTPYVMLHTWWHQCQCDMYRFTIPGFREGLPFEELQNLPPDFIAYCRDKCLEHALAVADIMAMVIDMGKDIFITDPALVMCTFHSARVISRLGSSQFANLPKDFLIAKLKACSDILEIPSEFYPTTKLLRSGICDLIHDAERDSGSSSPLRSNLDAERSESDTNTSAIGQPSNQSNTQGSMPEVYSKYSVTDEIRKLNFQQDDEETAQEYRAGDHDDTGGGGAFITTQHLIMAGTSKEFGPQPYLTMPQGTSANSFGSSGPGEGASAAPNDVSMTLGFEPSYGECQPDLFLDSFLPLQNDWSMADSGHF